MTNYTRQLCPAGWFSPNASGCYPCPVEFASSSGSYNCTYCDKGEYRSDNRSLCITCPMGTYNPVGGTNTSDACLLCPKGYYGPTLGANDSSQCLACGKGSYSDSEVIALVGGLATINFKKEIFTIYNVCLFWFHGFLSIFRGFKNKF